MSVPQIARFPAVSAGKRLMCGGVVTVEGVLVGSIEHEAIIDVTVTE